MTSGVVICSILFPCNQLLRMKKLAVSSNSNFVCNIEDLVSWTLGYQARTRVMWVVYPYQQRWAPNPQKALAGHVSLHSFRCKTC